MMESNYTPDVLDAYKEHHHILFVYKNKEYFLWQDLDYDYIQDGLRGDVLYKCAPDRAMTDIIIDGKPLLDVLKMSFIDSIY